ncbi:MAG TPA: GMC family oxidoreductase [Vicinamibacteria bacterium]|jgi:choline dehydrogenase-like flavoprotein|nr:GMC family oxidoreductase [Vicinamibacteria bacterium]
MSPSYRLDGPVETACDVVVIGSGAGGACVAAVCAEAGLDVIMLEEGPFVPTEQKPARLTTALLRQWRCSGLTAALGPTPVAYAEGRCVGGSTEINAAVFQRTPDELLERWAQDYRIADFGAAALAPHLDRAARVVNSSLTRGPLGRASEILHEAGRKLGWRATPLERGQRHCVGTNMCAHGCPTGAKQSMSNTLLPEALARGMRLFAECRATHLVVRGRRAIAVEAIGMGADGRRHRATLRPRLVFLCAGAIHTPAILRRSGLKRHVGDTLRMHPTLKCVALFDKRVGASDSRFPLYAISEFMPDQRLGGSIVTPGFFGMMLSDYWQHRKDLVAAMDRAGAYYAIVRGQGVGRIRTLPGAVEPVVSYRLAPLDWENLAKGLARIGRAMFASGATVVYPSIRGHAGWRRPEECDEFNVRGLPQNRTSLMTVHLSSSCPLGGDDRRSATDSFGRLHGHENVIVGDASQLPEAPGINPQATVMALAFRAAEHALAGGHELSRRASAEANR